MLLANGSVRIQGRDLDRFQEAKSDYDQGTVQSIPSRAEERFLGLQATAQA